MSRDDLHFRLRIPEALKASIHEAADANNRSMTAEIIARLEASQTVQPKTLRDEFAMAALAGLCGNPGGPFQANSYNGWAMVNCTPDQIAEAVYGLSDAMLAARKGGAE